jgi:hypothetical protein
MRLVFIKLLVLGGVIATLAVLACAKKGTPPGGPPDTTAPYVEEISPAGGSVDVDRGRHISIGFSEPMKKRTVETGVVVSPPCRWEKRHWEGLNYMLIPQGGLREDVTYLVSVSNKAEDSHGVAMKSTFVSGFSTGDTLDAGLISGAVRWKKMDVEGAVVFLFDAGEADSATGFPSSEPRYVTLSGSRGLYEIPFVDTEKTYRIFAIIDKDLDTEYDEGENVGCYNGDVVFGEVPEIEGIDLTICGETLLGGISGRIDTASVADTLVIAVTVMSIEDSSLVYRVRPEKSGVFEMKCVEPGLYRIRTFNDINSNLALDPGDSILVELPDTFRVDSCAEPPEVEIEFEHED